MYAKTDYQKICDKLRGLGEGNQDFNQAEVSNLLAININNGACYALVINWLIAQRNDVNFWQDLPAEKQISSASVEWFAKMVADQEKYLQKPGNNFVLDDWALGKLSKNKLRYNVEESILPLMNGGIHDSTETKRISESVIKAASRYFILAISPNLQGAHAMGIKRDKIGSVHFFDPNYGEFKLKKETKAVEKMLSVLAPMYPDHTSGFKLDGFEYTILG